MQRWDRAEVERKVELEEKRGKAKVRGDDNVDCEDSDDASEDESDTDEHDGKVGSEMKKESHREARRRRKRKKKAKTKRNVAHQAGSVSTEEFNRVLFSTGKDESFLEDRYKMYVPLTRSQLVL